jgi:hypothetical protein
MLNRVTRPPGIEPGTPGLEGRFPQSDYLVSRRLLEPSQGLSPVRRSAALSHIEQIPPRQRSTTGDGSDTPPTTRASAYVARFVAWLHHIHHFQPAEQGIAVADGDRYRYTLRRCACGAQAYDVTPAPVSLRSAA